MKALIAFLFFLVILMPARVCGAQAPAADGVSRLDAILGEKKTPTVPGPAMTLDEAEQKALTENSEIRVAARRVAMAEAHIATAGTLDDPQFMYRGWQVPLNQPWNYNDAQNMFMLSQVLPGPGKRKIQSTIATSEVTEAKDAFESVRLQVRTEVRRAFSDLLLAQEELRIHDQHLDIARQAIDAARIKYTVGKVPQQDVLKAQLALTRLAEHMIRFERDADVARARMNTLLGRPPDRPVRVEGVLGVETELPQGEDLESLAVHTRPDLLGAQAAVQKSRQEQALANKAYVPDFSVAGGYMLLPSGSTPRNNYMIEGSVTLPWLNRRKHDAEISEASAKVSEQDAEVDAMRNAAFGQIEEALADVRAAQRLARVYHESLEPQAEATLHAAVIAYENNQTDLLDLIDSEMAVIDVNLGWVQAMGDFGAKMADLELAVGAPIDSARVAAPEVKQ